VKKILVTGGAGFIGSHVVEAYLKRGHPVVVVDNLSTGRRENVPPTAAFYQVDIRDAQALNEVFDLEKPEIVNHHAAQMNVRISAEDPVFDAETNVLGSLNVLEACRRIGVEKLIYASSGGACYGETDVLPTPETHPTWPVSPYGVSKHAVEHYIFAYSKLYGLKYTILRYANIYGPRQNPEGEAGIVAIFASRMLRGEPCTIFGDGLHERDYLHVFDAAQINVLALDGADNEVLNVGTGVRRTNLDVFRTLAAAVGTDAEPQFGPERLGDLRASALDCTKAALLLGWRPTISFEEGIRQTVDWFRSTMQ